MVTRRTLIAGLAQAAVAAQGPARVPQVQVAIPRFPGQWLTNVNANDLQVLEYLALQMSFPQPASQQAAAIGGAAQKAVAQQRPGEAWFYYGLYFAARLGWPVDDALHAALSVNIVPESRVVRVAGRVGVQLEPWYSLPRPLRTSPVLTLRLENEAGQPAGGEVKVPVERLESQEVSLPLAKPEPGLYFAAGQIGGESGPVLARARRPVLMEDGLRSRAQSLGQAAEKLLLRANTPLESIAGETLHHVSKLYLDAHARYDAPPVEAMHPFAGNLLNGAVPRLWQWSVRGASEITALETLAASSPPVSPAALVLPRLRWALPGTDPRATFRVLLPAGFVKDRTWPLVVALAPEFGDESTLADMFVGDDGKTSLMGREASRRGYAVLLPSGGAPFAWIEPGAAVWVEELVRRFCSAWPVNRQQVFLWGHSFGGALAYRLLASQQLWAGAAIVAARPLRDFDFQSPQNIPLTIAAGLEDRLAPLNQMLAVAQKLKAAVPQQNFLRLAGQDHWSAGPASIPACFDFFDKLRAGTPGAG